MAFDISTAKPITDIPTETKSGFNLSTARPVEQSPSMGKQFFESAKQAGSGILEGAIGVVNLPMEAVRAAGEVTGVNRKFLPLSTTEINQRNIESGITADAPETTGGKAVRFTGEVLGGAATFPTPAITKTTTVTSEVPTVSKLKTLANQAYKKAEDANLVVSKDSFENAVNIIKQSATEAGIDPTLHPKAMATLTRLEGAIGQDMPLSKIETLRRVVKGASKSIEPDERRIAGIIRDNLDNYISSLKPSDVVSGDVKAGTEALQQARNLWSRASKGQVVEDLIKRAQNRSSQFSGSGYENALRTEFRNLAQNAKKLRLFTPTEQETIIKVARGGPLENSFRMLGKLAPTGIVSATLGGGAGYVAGGPVGSAAVMAAGTAGRIGARILTAKNARLASETMRGSNPLLSVTTSQVQKYLNPGTFNPLLQLNKDQ